MVVLVHMAQKLPPPIGKEDLERHSGAPHVHMGTEAVDHGRPLEHVRCLEGKGSVGRNDQVACPLPRGARPVDEKALLADRGELGGLALRIEPESHLHHIVDDLLADREVMEVEMHISGARGDPDAGVFGEDLPGLAHPVSGQRDIRPLAAVTLPQAQRRVAVVDDLLSEGKGGPELGGADPGLRLEPLERDRWIPPLVLAVGDDGVGR